MQRLSLRSKYVVLCILIVLIYTKKSKMRHLYTDWSSLWNPWPWWWGYVLLDETSKTKVEWAWWVHDTTNNRMELQAVIEGLQQLLKRREIAISKPMTDQWLGMFGEAQWWTEGWICDDEIIVFTDSNYVKQWITEWINTWIKRSRRLSKWGKLVKNADLWQQLHVLSEQFIALERQWVKAHAGNRWNERVDDLARGAAEEL